MIRLTVDPLEVAAAMVAVNDPAAGGIAIFAGTTRAETSGDGRELIALDYDAYQSMALNQLESLAKQAGDRWPVLRLVIWHRIGRVNVGDPSVVIAVATAHRKEAFAACQWLIDQLKSQAAIWKREMWADGASTWVHPNL